LLLVTLQKKTMQKKIYIVILVSLFWDNIYAQQNLFNIPSGDVTPKGKVFYQHQINGYSNKFESKGHFVYGLGNKWDVGVNLVGTGAYFNPTWKPIYNSDFSENKALSPTVMATLQKQLILDKHWSLNVGTQIGGNLSNNVSRVKPAYMNYGLVSYQFKPGRKLLIGPYFTNNHYVGKGNTFGFQAGYEWKLTKKWYLMGDFISGRNESSVLVTGLMYNLNKRVQLCLGYMVPNPNSTKKQGVVFEFNWYGWNF
jgi:hypothetical protein